MKDNILLELLKKDILKKDCGKKDSKNDSPSYYEALFEKDLLSDPLYVLWLLCLTEPQSAQNFLDLYPDG